MGNFHFSWARETFFPYESSRRGKEASCVALGRHFGFTSLSTPPGRAQLPLRTFRVRGGAVCGRGATGREVAPKFLPRATQDASFSPPRRLGWAPGERGGSSGALRHPSFSFWWPVPGDATSHFPLRREKRYSKNRSAEPASVFVHARLSIPHSLRRCDFGTNFFHRHGQLPLFLGAGNILSIRVFSEGKRSVLRCPR